MGEDKSVSRSERELSEKLEEIFRGLFLFLRRCVATAAHSAFSPARFEIRLRDEKLRDTYVGPYTFICLSGFAAVKLLRWIVIVLMVLLSSVFRSCSADTPQEFAGPTWTSLLAVPSMEDLLFIGAPLIAAILGLSWLLRVALTRAAPSLQPTFVNATCYSTGLQYLLCVPALALFYWVTFGRAMQAASPLLKESLLALVAALLVAWPAYSFHQLIDLDELAGRTRIAARALHRTAMWVASMLLSATTLILALGMAWPLAMKDYSENYDPKPMLQAARIDTEKPLPLRPASEIPVSISNSTDDSLQFRLDRAEIVDAGGASYDARIADGKALTGRVFSLGPRERSWILLKVGEANHRIHFFGSERPVVILYSIGRNGERARVAVTLH